MDSVRVIFRADKFGEVVAVFPDAEGRSDPNRRGASRLNCYAHVGQHGDASAGWYRTTRPATEVEYAPLLAELRGIYETGPDAVRLVVSKRR